MRSRTGRATCVHQEATSLPRDESKAWSIPPWVSQWLNVVVRTGCS
jgi:hypothetical protein